MREKCEREISSATRERARIACVGFGRLRDGLRKDWNIGQESFSLNASMIALVSCSVQKMTVNVESVIMSKMMKRLKLFIWFPFMWFPIESFYLMRVRACRVMCDEMSEKYDQMSPRVNWWLICCQRLKHYCAKSPKKKTNKDRFHDSTKWVK